MVTAALLVAFTAWRRVVVQRGLDGEIAEADGQIAYHAYAIIRREELEYLKARLEDLSKLLVHRRARRRGLGQALMRAAEAAAVDCGRTLLVLDTAGGDAERLYERLGWVRAGVIPGYALLPEGGPCDTTVFYRELA